MPERHPLPTYLKDQLHLYGYVAGQVTHPNPLASVFSSLTKDLQQELTCYFDGHPLAVEVWRTLDIAV